MQVAPAGRVRGRLEVGSVARHVVDALLRRPVDRRLVLRQVKAEKVREGRGRRRSVEIGHGRHEEPPLLPEVLLRRKHPAHLARTLQRPKNLQHPKNKDI